MNDLVVVNDAMKLDLYVQTVQNGFRREKLVVPIPPRMLSINVTHLMRTAANGPKSSGVLFATSGTVGASKLIARPARNIVEEACGIAISLGLSRNDKILITTPVTHSFGFGILMAAAEVGARVYVVKSSNIFRRVHEARELMKKHDFDLMIGVPFFYRMILRQIVDLRPPKLSLVGGETIPFDLIPTWQDKVGGILRQEYGLSEAGVVTVGLAKDPTRSLGSPVFGCRVEEDDGELVVYRTHNPTSYFLGESPETFTKDGGIRTGDLGNVVGDLVYLTGRKKSVVFIGGMNVVPEEVEQAILRTGMVEEAAVIGHTNRSGTQLVAFVAPWLFGRQVSALQEKLREELESYKIPQIKLMTELPRTATGKVDKSALQV